MKAVDQTAFGVPEGNCQSAAIASILELPIEDVPHFAKDGDTSADGMWAEMAKWLEPRGFYPINFLWRDDWNPFGYYLLFGKTERGPHCVVGKDRGIAHDPHPSRAGLLEREQAVILVPFDPARMRTVGPPHYTGLSDLPKLEFAPKEAQAIHDEINRGFDELQGIVTREIARVSKVQP